MTKRILTTAACITLFAGSAAAQSPAAQKRERGFIAINGGIQAAPADLTDRFSFEVNVEPADVDVAYPGKSGTLFDGGAGIRFWKAMGVGVAYSRSTAKSTAHVEADIPHPFFDDQDRHVSGDVADVSHNETAVHVQLYGVHTSGRWTMRVMAGATRFEVEQDVVTAVSVDETYPYDTATFRSATTRQSKASTTGFNVAGDVAWMFTRNVGVGAIARYSHGTVDLNVEGGRTVSIDVGGAQVGGGLRISF